MEAGRRLRLTNGKRAGCRQATSQCIRGPTSCGEAGPIASVEERRMLRREMNKPYLTEDWLADNAVVAFVGALLMAQTPRPSDGDSELPFNAPGLASPDLLTSSIVVFLSSCRSRSLCLPWRRRCGRGAWPGLSSLLATPSSFDMDRVHPGSGRGNPRTALGPMVVAGSSWGASRSSSSSSIGWSARSRPGRSAEQTAGFRRLAHQAEEAGEGVS